MADAPAPVRRRGTPVLLTEQFAVVGWLRDGDAISDIARRLQRSVAETRVIAFGPESR